MALVVREYLGRFRRKAVILIKSIKRMLLMNFQHMLALMLLMIVIIEIVNLQMAIALYVAGSEMAWRNDGI